MERFHLSAVVLVLLWTVLKVTDSAQYKRVCYYTNWSQYRPGVGKYTPDNIDPRLCTHLIFAFAKVANSELKTVEWNDVQMFQKFKALKQQAPGLKTLIAVGGWNARSTEFSRMVSLKSNRQKFVMSSQKFLRQYDFDGLDLDWEYPTKRGGKPSDRRNFVLLAQELKAAFKPDKFLLTAAVPAGKSNIDSGYDVGVLAQSLDFINLMTYDLHGSWERVTGENSPLFARSSDTPTQKQLTMKWAAEYWVAKGAPKSKLVIGMATYGRSFRLADPGKTEVGSPATGPGQAGTFTRQAGFLSYYEICTMQESGQGVTHWEKEQRVPYYTNGRLWVGFDDVRSITEKVKWVMQEGYAGAMIWSLALDDFNKVCKSSAVRYPLQTTIYKLLTSQPIPPTKQTTTPTHKTAHTTTTQKTTTTTHSGTGFSCANRADGFYADPDDCRRFYCCVNHRTYHYTCPASLFYNPKIKACDWPRHVDCKMEF